MRVLLVHFESWTGLLPALQRLTLDGDAMWPADARTMQQVQHSHLGGLRPPALVLMEHRQQAGVCCKANCLCWCAYASVWQLLTACLIACRSLPGQRRGNPYASSASVLSS